MTDIPSDRVVESTGHSGQRVLDELFVTVIMARVTDHFGFFVYAFASVLVFPKVFFSYADPATAMLLSFMVFPLAFLVRPFASQVFKLLEPRFGRSGKVAAAIGILCISTMAIGLLPSCESAGMLAPVLLIALRVAQGIGLGGGWDGLTLLLQTNAPENRRGWYAMIPQLGAPIGLCVAAAIFYVLTGFLTEQEFYQWGWRWPFFAVLAVNVVSLFARLQLIHSKEHVELQKEQQLYSSPFFEMLRAHWRGVLLGTLLPLASYALMHMVSVFPLAHMVLTNQAPISDFLFVEIMGGALFIVAVVMSGVLADMIGRRRLLAATSVLIGGYSFLITTLFDGGIVFTLFGFLLLGLSYGQASSILPNRFEKKYRYTAAALSTNLSWIFGAAFAPLVALWLSQTYGLASAGLYLLSGALVTLGALAVLKYRVRPAR